MNALEFPIEALAFNYLSYSFLTAVNSLWAWLAVLTAAVSFWHIRSQPPLPDSKTEPLLAETSIPSETAHSSPARETMPFYVSESSRGVKFTLYYKDDCQIVGDDIFEDDGGETVVSENVEWWCDDLREIMRVRMGDLGWYRCHDLTVLDGSVVRLWDGDRRLYNAASASLMYGGAAVVW